MDLLALTNLTQGEDSGLDYLIDLVGKAVMSPANYPKTCSMKWYHGTGLAIGALVKHWIGLRYDLLTHLLQSPWFQFCGSLMRPENIASHHAVLPRAELILGAGPSEAR